MLLILILSRVVHFYTILVRWRPHPYAAMQEIQRLKLLKSNLQRAGVLGPDREKSLSGRIAEL